MAIPLVGLVSLVPPYQISWNKVEYYILTTWTRRLLKGPSAMPIYEYTCKDCGSDFELLIRGEEKPVCPSCGKRHLAKSFSVPAAHSGHETKELPCRTAGCDMGQCGGMCGMGH